MYAIRSYYAQQQPPAYSSNVISSQDAVRLLEALRKNDKSKANPGMIDVGSVGMMQLEGVRMSDWHEMPLEAEGPTREVQTSVGVRSLTPTYPDVDRAGVELRMSHLNSRNNFV